MATNRVDGRGVVYLDHNATTPIDPAACTAMLDAVSVHGNPSSVHETGRLARDRLERARRQVARFLGARPEHLIFTSGGTEADLLALRGVPARYCIVSAIEHDAVLAAVPDAYRLPVTAQGIVDLAALEHVLESVDDPAVVSVMWANNETGAIQPIRDVVRICRAHGALVHSDAVQAAGKLPINFLKSGIDMLSVSAHKFGGPPGVGALLVRNTVALIPLHPGGGQERGRRSGTENLPGIAGFGAAAEAAGWTLPDMERVCALRDRLEAQLLASAPDARVLCADVERLPNTSCVVMPGVAAETQVMAFDLEGLAVSAGSACSSGKVSRSHVIDAMEPNSDAAVCAVRISLGRQNVDADIDRLVSAWLALYKRLGALCKVRYRRGIQHATCDIH